MAIQKQEQARGIKRHVAQIPAEEWKISGQNWLSDVKNLNTGHVVS